MKKSKQKKKRTLKAFLVAFIALLVLPGCTTTTMKGGSGQLFKLSEHQVVYRDLTVPVGLGNEPEKRTSQDYPSVAP